MIYRKLTELTKLENNPRTIKADDFEKLKKSIEDNKDYFDGRPLLLSNRTGSLVIIGGNQRYEAAKALGMDEVPTHLMENLTEAKEREIIIRDNISNGEFDWDVLANSWSDEPLDDWGLDTPSDWNNTDIDEDEAPPVANVAVSKLGEIYQLGRHRVMCGDSTDGEAVSKLLDGKMPNLMVTDPPYGVKYDADWRDETESQRANSRSGDVLNDDRVDWTAAYELFGGDIAYIWHSALHTHEVAQNLIDLGYKLVAQIIWVKQHLVLSRGDYHWQHEPCWYAVKKDAKHNWNGNRKQTTTWEIANSNPFTGKGNSDDMKTDHGTQKPVECMSKPIVNNSEKGEDIYDPFGGSGTTLIACEQLDRNCYMMELDPKYCDVIRKRYWKFTNDNNEEGWEEGTPSL